ncbi:M4 family metallopeptidase [Candidatus Obscuribacterales bacterium]|nr:M4 family metallopeptidase [Candidatus Obscuribacterales bacterium]
MSHHIEGYIYADLLLELARRNPNNLNYALTLVETQKLFQKGQSLVARRPGLFAGAGNGDRKIYDAQGRQSLPGTKARFEGDKATGDVVVDNAYEFHGGVKDFLAQVVKRNSIDDAGMALVGTVHYGRKYNNAFWNGSQMTYGDGDGDLFQTFVIEDVVGHEMAHGVTEHTSSLVYQGQSGALNEHFSDVVGVLCRQYRQKLSAADDSWLVGPGLWTKKVNGRALRDMLNPGTAYDDPKTGKDPQPAHMKDLYTGWSDNGGVHINSGIPNKAFATFARAVGGNAWERPFEIWYATNCGANRVTSKADFKAFVAKSLENCRALHPTLEADLKAAWAAVGL